MNAGSCSHGDYGNKIFKLDVNDVNKSDFIGFTEDNVSASSSVTVIPPESAISSFTGLTENAVYYGSTTPGAITPTNPAASNVAQVIVGRASSSTNLLTQRYPKRKQ